MYDPGLVGRSQTGEDLSEDRQRPFGRKRSLPFNQSGKGFAVQQLHGEETDGALRVDVLADIVKPANIRVGSLAAPSGSRGGSGPSWWSAWPFRGGAP